ncbi:MAG: hypothetical protein GY941_17480 [Planctomycetes bacterium]|nr:hypothetical protein [Planctomycetota bacterium]
MNIKGYRITEIISKNDTSIVYKTETGEDLPQAIAKLPIDDHPGQRSLDRINLEYGFLCRMSSENIIRAYGLEKLNGRPVMLLEDFGGESL